MKKTSSILLTAVALAMASTSQAALVVTTSAGTGSNLPDVSSVDLLQTSVASTAFVGGFTRESPFGGPTVLTDGLKGLTVSASSTEKDYAVAGDSTAGALGPQVGKLATYTFDTSINTLGYDISSVDVFSGWNDPGRDQILVEVLFSTVAAPSTFTSLTTLNFNPTTSAFPAAWGRALLTEDTTGIVASGVAAIQFNFNLAVENGYTGYREIDVFGTATAAAIPEPGTFAALAGLGVLGFAATRRRRS